MTLSPTGWVSCASGIYHLRRPHVCFRVDLPPGETLGDLTKGSELYGPDGQERLLYRDHERNLVRLYDLNTRSLIMEWKQHSVAAARFGGVIVTHAWSNSAVYATVHCALSCRVLSRPTLPPASSKAPPTLLPTFPLAIIHLGETCAYSVHAEFPDRVFVTEFGNWRPVTGRWTPDLAVFVNDSYCLLWMWDRCRGVRTEREMGREPGWPGRPFDLVNGAAVFTLPTDKGRHAVYVVPLLLNPEEEEEEKRKDGNARAATPPARLPTPEEIPHSAARLVATVAGAVSVLPPRVSGAHAPLLATPRGELYRWE